MKTRSMFIALVLAIGVSTMGWADLNESDYRTVAENFLLYQNSSKNIVSTDTIKDGERIIAYVMVLEGGGYLLVPATTLLPPVKAYSLQSNFENLPPGYKAFLISELKTLQNEARISTRNSEPTENSERWDFLLSYKERKVSLRYSPGTFLLTTQWGQDYPYNKKIPLLPTNTCELNGQNAVTGCVQTAWAQIMRFHKYPARGNGIADYTWNFTLVGGTTPLTCSHTFDVILNKNYNWDNMPNVSDTSSPEYQQDEVAMLMRDLAIVNQANFNRAETSTEYNKRRIIQYFGYSSAMTEMSNADETSFFNTLKSELDTDRPVFLGLKCLNCTDSSGQIDPKAGHAVVGDGYKSDATGNQIHINMGWKGSSDAFYYLNGTINADKSGTFSTSPPTITMLYNIKPCSSANNDCFENFIASEQGDSISGSTISGQFSNQDDIDAYPIYLKGNLTLTGKAASYSSGGFFIRVYNSKFETIISAANPPVSISSLAADKYYIDVSLSGEQSSYSYTGYPVSYTVNISSQSLTPAEISAIDTRNTPPVINNDFKTMSINSAYQMRIDSADADNGDTVTLSAVSSNANVTVSISKDVLTITPQVAKGYSEITITASDGKAQTEKSFGVFITDTLFGKSFKIAGKFVSQSDLKKYKVVLDGTCTISGNNGNWQDDSGKLFTQGFYTAVKDSSDQSYIVPMTTKQDIMNTFPKKSYLIGASLQYTAGGMVYSYPYQTGNGDSFTITVSCPNADDSVAAIGNILGIPTTYTPGLADVIQLLRILCGIDATYQWQDVNNDGKFGLEEAIYILQVVAGLR